MVYNIDFLVVQDLFYPAILPGYFYMEGPGHLLTNLHFLGRKFNLYGELIQRRTKWSDPSIEKKKKRTKCLVDQFNKFKIGKDLHVSALRVFVLSARSLGSSKTLDTSLFFSFDMFWPSIF